MDWLLIVINTVFVAAGIIMLPREPTGGILTLAFFGSCLVIAVRVVVGKLRARRFTAERIDVAGGVPIRPSRIFLPLLGGWLAVLGVILYVFGGELPLIFRAIAVFIAIVGVAVLVLSLTGVISAGFLQFDPDALTIAQRKWRVRIPWDDIDGVHEGEFASNPLLFLTLSDLGRLEIEPADARGPAMDQIHKTQSDMGADFAINTWHYGIPLPLLSTTIAHYVVNSAARAELRPRLT